jgi:membrane protease YdiL (CAAX protease family)
MRPTAIFLNPETNLLRSGWRFLIFTGLLVLPGFLLSGGGEQPPEPQIQVSAALITSYLVSISWVLLLSWFCLRLLDQRRLASLGVAPYHGWWREVLLGCAVSAAMMTAVVALQWLGGGSRLMLNPAIWSSADQTRAGADSGLLAVIQSAGAALALFIIAGALEELIYRGYAFQTLLRGAPTLVPLLLLSLLFGLAHWPNPGATGFALANTFLAGIWLAVAYLKTRSLWFPTGLHFMWNWMMNAFFGLPVSGLRVTPSSVFIATSESPVWLTGGSYGSEGGAAVTIVLALATLLIWRARWLKVSPAMRQALEQSAMPDEPHARLNLGQPE